MAFDEVLSPVLQTDLRSKYHPVLVAYQNNEWIREQMALLESHGDLDHAVRVAFLAAELAKHVEMNDDEILIIAKAGLLHDLGKLQIPPEIFKKVQLTEKERALVDEHVRAGFELVKERFPFVAKIMVAHHEFQARRYPRKNDRDRVGTRLRELQRLLAIADQTDALLSARSYKKRWPIYKVREYLNDLFDDHHLIDFSIAKRISIVD